MKPRFHRGKLLIDKQFQMRILVRMGGYLLFWTFTAFHISFFVYLFRNFAQASEHAGIDRVYLQFVANEQHLLTTLIVVSPILLYDLLRFSNRIAGPLYRCRKAMQDMAAGKTVPEFIPRKYDLLDGFFRDFNTLVRQWNKMKVQNQEGELVGEDLAATVPTLEVSRS
jgi:hypothetical protein